jgi:hypothetical protein
MGNDVHGPTESYADGHCQNDPYRQEPVEERQSRDDRRGHLVLR